MGLQEDLKEKPSKLAAEIADHLRSELSAVTAEKRLGQGAGVLGRLRPFAWLGWLSEKLPWWAELTLIGALIIGVFLGWNSFKEWAAKDAYDSQTSELQQKLKASKAETQTAIDEAVAAKADYLVEKAKAEALEGRKAEIVHEVQRVIVTVDKANKGYIVSKEQPVGVFTMTGDVIKDHRKVIEEVGRRINLAEAVK